MDNSENLKTALIRLQFGKATPAEQRLCYERIQEIENSIKKPKPSLKKGDLTKKFRTSLMVERYLDKSWVEEYFRDEADLRQRVDESETAYLKRVVYPCVAEVFKVEQSTVERNYSEYKTYFEGWPRYTKEHFKELEQAEFSKTTQSLYTLAKSGITYHDIKARRDNREK